MIRAKIQGGKIQPLDPLPPSWGEGRELLIEEAEAPPSSTEIDEWFRRVEQAAAVTRPEDHTQLEAELAEVERISKEQARKEMGLDG